MNYLLARVRDRRNGLRLVISNNEIYSSPDMIDEAVIYAQDDSIEDGEWFYLDNFSQREYCPDFLKTQINGAAYAAIDDTELDKISFLFSSKFVKVLKFVILCK